jgi:hypothetical protein
MVAAADNAVGLGWVDPLIKHIQMHPSNGVWAHYIDMDVVTRTMQSFLPAKSLGGDWTQFDSTLGFGLLEDALEVILLPYYRKQDRDKFRKWAHFALRVELMLDEYTVMVDRGRGMPSGLAITNLLECAVNVALQYFLALEVGYKVTKMMVNGDDSLVEMDRTVDKNLVAECEEAAKLCGLGWNKNKAEYGDVVSYLRLVWYPGMTAPAYPIGRALWKLIFRERGFPAGTNMREETTRRSAAILENCFSHPRREWLREFMVRHDNNWSEVAKLHDPTADRQPWKRRSKSWFL